jgi:alpha-tubulin suppressor-like RCC1 family protein
LCGQNIVDYANGFYHVVARTEDGRLFNWGFFKYAHFKDSRVDKTVTTDDSRIHSIGFTEDGHVFCCGFDKQESFKPKLFECMKN